MLLASSPALRLLLSAGAVVALATGSPAQTTTTFTAPAARGKHILLVDSTPSPCAFATTIQAAVDAATDDDFIWVEPGVYAGFSIRAKTVRLFAAGPLAALIRGPIEVVDLRADQQVVLRNLDQDSGYGFRARDDHGPIWLESSFLPMADIQRCAVVGFSRMTVSGRPDPSFFPSHAPLLVRSSTIYAYDSDFAGAPGNDAETDSGSCVADPGREGYSGMDLLAPSSAYLFGCRVRGGRGGNGTLDDPCHVGACGYGASGSPAIRFNAGTTVVSMDSQIIAGAPGLDVGCGTGFNAPALSGGGTHTVLSGKTAGFQIDFPPTSARSTSVQFKGPPGFRAFLTYSPTFGPAFLPERKGYSVVDPDADTVFVGTIPASGILRADLPLPRSRHVGPLLFYVQGKLYDPVLEEATLAAPSAVLLARYPCR